MGILILTLKENILATMVIRFLYGNHDEKKTNR